MRACGAAAAAWRRASQAWSYLSGGADAGGEQVAAGRELRQRLSELLREGTGWAPAEVMAERADIPDLLATMRQAMGEVYRLGEAYQATATSAVAAGGIQVPARLLLDVEGDPTPAVVQAALAGHVVTLAAASVPGRELIQAARLAARDRRTARALTATTARATVARGRWSCRPATTSSPGPIVRRGDLHLARHRSRIGPAEPNRRS